MLSHQMFYNKFQLVYSSAAYEWLPYPFLKLFRKKKKIYLGGNLMILNFILEPAVICSKKEKVD